MGTFAARDAGMMLEDQRSTGFHRQAERGGRCLAHKKRMIYHSLYQYKAHNK